MSLIVSYLAGLSKGGKLYEQESQKLVAYAIFCEAPRPMVGTLDADILLRGDISDDIRLASVIRFLLPPLNAWCH